MKIDWNKKYTTIAAYVLIVATIGIVVYFFFRNFTYFKNVLNTVIDILTPFFIGVIFAYVLNPIVRFFETKALPFITRSKLTRRSYRNISIALTILLTFALVYILFSFIIPELFRSVNGLISQLASHLPNLEKYISDLLVKLNMEESFAPILSKVAVYLENLFSQFFDLLSKSLYGIINATINITTTVISIFVGVMIAIYLWSSKELFFAQSKKISYSIFSKSFVDKSIDLLHEANAVFGGFISGKIIDSAIIGVICYIGMLILNIPYPLLISVIVGVTNIIPYFGPFIGAIPSILFLLFINPLKALVFAVFILVLQQIDGNIIGPKILGNSTGLSAFWVIFAVTVFGGLFGFLGMLLGVPLFAILYTIVRRAVNVRLTRKGLSTDTETYASENNKIIKKAEKIAKGEKDEK